MSGQQPGKTLECFGPLRLQAQGLAEGADGFSRFSALGESEAEVVMGLGIIRGAEGGDGELLERLFQAALFGERHAEDVVLLGIIQMEALNLRKLEESRRDLSLIGQVDSQVEVGAGETGVDPHRLEVMGHRLGKFPFIFQGHPQIVVGQEIIVGDSESVLKERAAVLPFSHIRTGPAQTGHQRQRTDSHQWPSALWPAGGRGHQAPSQHHEQTDERNIGVTIRHRLSSHLDQADDRDQRALIP